MFVPKGASREEQRISTSSAGKPPREITVLVEGDFITTFGIGQQVYHELLGVFSKFSYIDIRIPDTQFLTTAYHIRYHMYEFRNLRLVQCLKLTFGIEYMVSPLEASFDPPPLYLIPRGEATLY